MKTNYYEPQIVSPFRVVGKKAVIGSRDKNHPIQEEVRKSVGLHNLTVEFSEDLETIKMFPNIQNLIAFTCRILKNGEVIGFGHAASALNKFNRFIDRAVRATIGASLVDAVVRSKMLDALHFGPDQKESAVVDEAYEVMKSEESEPITTRQRSYLLELLNTKVDDEGERNKLVADLECMSKVDASDLIASLKDSG